MDNKELQVETLKITMIFTAGLALIAAGLVFMTLETSIASIGYSALSSQLPILRIYNNTIYAQPIANDLNKTLTGVNIAARQATYLSYAILLIGAVLSIWGIIRFKILKKEIGKEKRKEHKK